MKKTFTHFKCLLFLFFCGAFSAYSQVSWTVAPTQAPYPSGGLMLLLSDGSILCKSTSGGPGPFGNMWYKLTPNANGSYLNGTWSTLPAPMNDTRLYCSSQLMKDGRLYVAGGEYGTGVSTSEIYDPVSNTWSSLFNPNFVYYADANSAILDDGRILQADLANSFKQTYIFNPTTMSYVPGPNTIGMHAESTWIKLPDNSILFVDMNSTSSERYIPSTNQWVNDGTTPTSLYDPYIYEIGPAMLLPNGKVIMFGATGNTGIYTPSGNTSPGSWASGGTMPSNMGCPDTQCAMTVDGKILLVTSKSVTSAATAFDPPAYFYEYDYVTNGYTQLQAPGGGTTVNDSAFNFNMVNLPDGTIMLSQVGNKNFYFHKPSGAPLAAGVPTISSIFQNGCSNSFTATGILFNGISEGASFGDDWQMNSNFPIIRLQSGSNVYYARTRHWNHTGVQTGSLADTTQFNLPPNIPAGTYSLYVVVNGISSAPYTFTFNPFPALTSPLTMPAICSGSTFNYNPTTNLPGTTLQWTRAAVNSIVNPAITTAQTSNPSETFTVTGNIPKTAVYSYTLTNGSCVTNYSVSCLVSPGPDLVISGTSSICPGTSGTLTATGANTYTWSTGANTGAISVSPSVTTGYTISGTDFFGCSATIQKTVTVKPTPTFSLVGDTEICGGDTAVLSVSGNASVFHWSTGASTYSIAVTPLNSTSYFVTCNVTGGCPKTSTVMVTVDICEGVEERTAGEYYKVYPNPFSQVIILESRSKQGSHVNIHVNDLFGRTIKKEEWTTPEDNSSKEIRLDELDGGVYFLFLEDETSRTCTKILKE